MSGGHSRPRLSSSQVAYSPCCETTLAGQTEAYQEYAKRKKMVVGPPSPPEPPPLPYRHSRLPRPLTRPTTSRPVPHARPRMDELQSTLSRLQLGTLSAKGRPKGAATQGGLGYRFGDPSSALRTRHGIGLDGIP